MRVEGQAADGSHSLPHEAVVVFDVVDQLPVAVVDGSELVHGATGREGMNMELLGILGGDKIAAAAPGQSAAAPLSGAALTGGWNHTDLWSAGTGKHRELIPNTPRAPQTGSRPCGCGAAAGPHSEPRNIDSEQRPSVQGFTDT